MIKILLVDDESWIRTSLKNKINWEKFEELVLCGEASDGCEALSLAVNLRPDIIITDVRMPGMNGIEMLTKMKEILPDIQSIFISGYNEFDYVKSAIELNASGYVLKPIRREELNKTLERTLEKIQQNNLLHRTMQTQMELLHRILEALFNQLPVSDELLSQTLSDLHFHQNHMYLLLLRILETGEDPLRLTQKISAAVASFSAACVCTVFPVSRTVYGILLSSPKKVELISYGRTLIRKLTDNAALDGSIALGTPAHSVKELPDAFSSARNSLSLMHLYGSHELILPNADAPKEQVLSLPKELQNRIMDSIFAHNLPSLELALKNLEDFFKENQPLTLQDITRILHLLLGNILQILYEQDIPKDLADKGISVMQNLSPDQSQDSILKRFSSYCMEAARLTAHTSSISATIQKAEQYLADHYREDISLKKMASLFYLNASYFSVSFKNVTGKNFNEYLTGLRIEHAKQYLQQSDMKVHQAARLVGYEDCSYFGKLFRKTTGMTPAEYQRQFLP